MLQPPFARMVARSVNVNCKIHKHHANSFVPLNWACWFNTWCTGCICCDGWCDACIDVTQHHQCVCIDAVQNQKRLIYTCLQHVCVARAVCMYVEVCMYIYICYIYIHRYMYTYIHIYIYICCTYVYLSSVVYIYIYMLFLCNAHHCSLCYVWGGFRQPSIVCNPVARWGSSNREFGILLWYAVNPCLNLDSAWPAHTQPVWSGQWYCISLLHVYVCTGSVYLEYDFIWRLKLKR